MFGNRRFFLIVLFILFFLYGKPANASTNCCFGHDGNYACNEQTGQLYCRDGSVSSVCSCQIPSQPTATPTPTAISSPIQTLEDCPVNSSYDTNAQQCVCNSGYVVSNNTCISDSNYCWDQYGGNSSYDSSNQSCTCSQGYIWNSTDTSCISLNTYCQNSLGNDSYYNNSSNTCTCDQGFIIQNNQCQSITTQTSSTVNNISQPILTTVPIIPTIAKNFPAASVTPINPLPTFKPTLDKKSKSNLNLKNFVTVNNKQQNGIKQLFIAVWNFIRGIFGYKSTNSSNTNASQNSSIYTSKYKMQNY